MRSIAAHPIAVLTVACAYWVAAAVWETTRDPAGGVLVTAILESPLVIILWAHFRRARSWPQHAWLTFCAALIAFACVFALFYVEWLHAGWLVLCVFAGLLFALAAVCVLLVRPDGRAPNAA